MVVDEEEVDERKHPTLVQPQRKRIQEKEEKGGAIKATVTAMLSTTGTAITTKRNAKNC